MVFSSMLFLICFLPACLAVYYIVHFFFKNRKIGIKIENGVLLLFSLAFYSFGGVKYLTLLFGVIILNWISGAFVAPKFNDDKSRKKVLIVTLVLNFLLLFFFKYFNLTVAMIENLFMTGKPIALRSFFLPTGNGKLGVGEIVLPIGISFYMFQALSYVIDVYRGNVRIQRNIFKFALYISFFPQLIAGPIVQYKDIEEKISEREVSIELFSEGVKRFCIGLGKKVLIANTMAEVVDSVWELRVGNLGALLAWFTAIAYSFQIYYDFSGYSDMAIGLGKMFGFEFKENFNHPYLSDSIQEFWRRWHISLSSWFRDYVYIPLGGSRCSKGKLYRNIMIVFMLTGIWHGANQTFLCWGFLYGILLILDRAFMKRLTELNPIKIINRIVTFAVVTILWVIFRADTMMHGRDFIVSMFSKGTGDYKLMSYLSFNVIVMFIAAILASGILNDEKLNLKLINRLKSNTVLFEKITHVWCILIFILSIVFLVNGSYNPFIYFQF